MMEQFYISRDQEMTVEILSRLLNLFQTWQLPELTKKYKYYEGKQEILKKSKSDGKPCNKIVCNFVKNIVDTYEGYTVGIPITYASDDKGFEELMDILNYNDINDEDAELFRQGLIYGRGAEIHYFDADGKTRFKTTPPTGCFPVYDDTLDSEMLYAIRFWQLNLADKKTEYMVEVYDSRCVTTYRSNEGFSSFAFIEQHPHNFDQVPVVFFSLNTEESAVAESVFSLQDAYNSLISDSIDNWDSFCDAYLVLKGVTADENDLIRMKKDRAFSIDVDADVSFLVKETNTAEIENLLSTVEEKIREMAACPNFASETFGTSSGIAIKYRLMAMSNNVTTFWNNFKKALQKRIELLAGVSRLLNGEALWRDITLEYTPNLPVNVTDIASEVNSLRGLVSDETLLSQLPFITDVDAELEKIKKQKEENMEVYSFGVTNESVLDEETDGSTE